MTTITTSYFPDDIAAEARTITTTRDERRVLFNVAASGCVLERFPDDDAATANRLIRRKLLEVVHEEVETELRLTALGRKPLCPVSLAGTTEPEVRAIIDEYAPLLFDQTGEEFTAEARRLHFEGGYGPWADCKNELYSMLAGIHYGTPVASEATTTRIER